MPSFQQAFQHCIVFFLRCAVFHLPVEPVLEQRVLAEQDQSAGFAVDAVHSLCGVGPSAFRQMCVYPRCQIVRRLSVIMHQQESRLVNDQAPLVFVDDIHRFKAVRDFFRNRLPERHHTAFQHPAAVCHRLTVFQDLQRLVLFP